VSYSYLYTRRAAVEYDIKDAAVSESALMTFGVDSKSRLRAHAAHHHHKNREIAFFFFLLKKEKLLLLKYDDTCSGHNCTVLT